MQSKPVRRSARASARVRPILAAAPFAGATSERVLAEYVALAFSDLRRLVDWGPDGVVLRPAAEISAEDARTVAEVSETSAGSRRVKLHDKRGALDSLARCLGLFVDRHELTGAAGSAIELAGAFDLSRLDDSELRTFEALLAKTVRANGQAHANARDGADGTGEPPSR